MDDPAPPYFELATALQVVDVESISCAIYRYLMVRRALSRLRVLRVRFSLVLS